MSPLNHLLRTALAICLVGFATPTRAFTIKYALTFTGDHSFMGSGTLTMTFDDIPNTTDPFSHDFTDVSGTGSGGYWGNWDTAAFIYEPATGFGIFALAFSSGGDVQWQQNVGTGLSPLAALEKNFVLLNASGSLNWSRATNGVPDAAATAALASVAFGLLGFARRFLGGAS